MANIMYGTFEQVKRMLILDLSDLEWLKSDKESYLEFDKKHEADVTQN